MVTTVIIYLSLILQILAAAIAISLFKRTKFNASWILISSGFILIVVYRIFELWPTIYPKMEEQLVIIQKWLAFVIALVLFLGVFYIRKIFQFLRRLDELRNETEKKVLSAVIKTEEQERQRFAKELHDGIGPLLSVIKMLVSGLDSARDSEMNEKIKQNLLQAVDEAVIGVRNVSANISPHILNNFGLHDAVDSFIKKIGQTNQYTITFTSNIQKKRFVYNVEVIMYRVICELINNTLKHADANAIVIDLHQEEQVLYLEYIDNGKGFNVEEQSSSGMGLENMRYRLNSGNGDIQIRSEKGRGVRAYAYINV
ncbi:MAG: sensor histidine kinase [Marinifilaceae bacterium]